MSRTPRRRGAAMVLPFACLALLAAPISHAGQVRVDVGSPSNTFTPYAVNCNIGDQVCWVWRVAGHTVTNWSVPADSVAISIDGTIFDSDPGGNHFGQPSTTRFSWKSDRLGHVPYVCVPHIPDMSGRVIVSDPNAGPKIAVADFRITEVQYDVASGQDLIEITNYGQAGGDLGTFRISSGGITAALVGPPTASTSILVASGARVVIHLNVAGTNTNSDLFMAFNGATGLPNANGSLALYVPHTLSPGNALTNTAMIIDFVQWGAGAQANEVTAVGAGFWGAGTFLPTVAAGHSLEYCANVNLDHGSGRWAEVSTPNFGTDGQCLTPVLDETWGRVKTRYRK